MPRNKRDTPNTFDAARGQISDQTITYEEYQRGVRAFVDQPVKASDTLEPEERLADDSYRRRATRLGSPFSIQTLVELDYSGESEDY